MAVRRLIFFATVMMCLASAGPAWAGTLIFNAPFQNVGQGAESFTPGVGDSLTIGVLGSGGNGALITDFFNTVCGGDCHIVGGFMALSSGPETSGSGGGGSFAYFFGSGGTMQIWGKIPSLGINSTSLLLSASFLSASFAGNGAIGSYAGTINPNTVILNAALGSYHFLNGMADDLSFNISPSCGTGGVCTGTINQSVNQFTVPEPATLSVLGVGLFAFGTGLRRKLLA